MAVLRLQPELEQSLREIESVRAVTVVTDGSGRPTEVHVLGSPAKPAKQVVRDVQSLALARHDIEIDHRIVSVVQIGAVDMPVEAAAPAASTVTTTPDQPEAETGSAHDGAPRVEVESVGVRTRGKDCEVEVTLTAGAVDFHGTATGPAGGVHRPRITAKATLDAVQELIGSDLDVDSAQVIRVGAHDIALTLLLLTRPQGDVLVLSGSATVRDDPADAVARSVLDALNRQLLG